MSNFHPWWSAFHAPKVWVGSHYRRTGLVDAQKNGVGGEGKKEKKRERIDLRKFWEEWRNCGASLLFCFDRPAAGPSHPARPRRRPGTGGGRPREPRPRLLSLVWTSLARSPSPARSRALRSRAFLPRTSIGRRRHRRRRHLLLAAVAPGSSVERSPFRFL